MDAVNPLSSSSIVKVSATNKLIGKNVKLEISWMQVVELFSLALLWNFQPNGVVQLLVVARDHCLLAQVHQQTLETIMGAVDCGCKFVFISSF